MRTILVLAGLPVLAAQPAAVSFEVASVKTNAGRESQVFEVTPRRLSIRNADLGHIIMRAYNLAERNFASVGSYLPLLLEHYDIDARAAHPAGRTEMMLMLQRLLADRFRLAMHTEVREMNGYVLLVDKDGPKLRQHAGNQADCSVGSSLKGQFREMEFRNCPVGRFVLEWLGPWAGSIVEDQTGLDGNYDFEFLFSREESANPREGRAEPRVFNDGAPSVFAAVRQQLGLRLESRKLAVAMYTIDHVEKPSAN